MTHPIVSVVMAAYNGATLVGETLASLGAQTLGDFEVIVVDDCSTDDTLSVLRAWPDRRVRVIAAEVNGGPVRARNIAFAEARGRYVAALDQDDLCRPERFARQVAYLETHPDTVLLGTSASVLNEGGAVTAASHAPLTTPGLIEWLLHIENPLVWSSVMLRADAARTLDVFTRPELLYAEDFDLYHRMAGIGRVARLDEELVIYRCHSGGASQRFVDTMHASAGRVLAGRHACLFGNDAAAASRLIVRHVMGRIAPPNGETLVELGRIIAALQDDFLARQPADSQSLKLIRWETARRWARIVRSGLRAGTISLGDAVGARPQHMGLGHAGADELVWSRLIGGARSVGRRYARR